MQTERWILGLAALATLGLTAAALPPAAQAEEGQRVFELRTYTTAPGKLDALQARFRDHTVALFEKHGMTNVGYWISADAPSSGDTLVYLLAHDSREAAGRSWDGFRKDPAWATAKEASQVGGRLVIKVESVFLTSTDFSAMK
jgi:hypothetical protein